MAYHVAWATGMCLQATTMHIIICVKALAVRGTPECGAALKQVQLLLLRSILLSFRCHCFSTADIGLPAKHTHDAVSRLL